MHTRITLSITPGVAISHRVLHADKRWPGELSGALILDEQTEILFEHGWGKPVEILANIDALAERLAVLREQIIAEAPKGALRDEAVAS